ncbi:hypothetical protein [Flavobacterium bizetiae]|uniref:hypothetical protein n=1 Tax=Flavobacterium bizetiae TaxID=2704140 RepID=UPI003757E9DB
MKHNLSFYTQYSQFYITDKLCQENTSDDFWTESAFNDRLALTKCGLAVGTECYGDVKGELVVLEKANDTVDLNKYDHIVEGGIQVQSGILNVLDCPNNSIELEVNVKPGNYRIRVYSINLASVVGDDGDDFYKIEIWPDNNMERKVLKRYVRK